MALSIPKEKVLEAYQNAPALVRETFNDPATNAVIANLRSAYQLHVDVSGQLGKSAGYLLLGLISPTEFYGQLVSEGTPPDTANKIVAEINQKIFMPLQQKMRAGQETPQTSSQEAYVPPAAVTSVPTPPEIPTTTPKAQEPVYATPQMPSPSNQTAPIGVITRTMASDMEALMHPDQPHMPIPSPAQSSPARSFQTASVPNTAPEPPRIVMPPIPVASRPVPTVPTIAPAPQEPVPVIETPVTPSSWKPVPPDAVPSSSIPTRPILKEYGVDPYRETPE